MWQSASADLKNSKPIFQKKLKLNSKSIPTSFLKPFQNIFVLV